MKGPIIPTIEGIILILIPCIFVILLQFKWQQNYKRSIISICRMLIQLLVVGYVLTFIFKKSNIWILIGIFAFMLTMASRIIYKTTHHPNKQFLYKSFIALSITATSMLLFVLYLVIKVDKPYENPSYVIPLGGMIIANTMNALSLAYERYVKETSDGQNHEEAKHQAFKAALIPGTNSLLAVGIVSLPGMMTGQILSGIDPLIACRYQIVVMATVFGSGGLASALFLSLLKPKKTDSIES